MANKPTNLPEWCTSGIKRDPNSTMQERGWDTSDGTANGIGEKPTLEHTNGWMHNVCEFIKYLIPLTSDPVGTISVSMLTEQQMNQDNAGLWVLCDGRTCGGTGYAELTGNNKVPDLRKKYMVGAGTNDNGTFFSNLLDEKEAYIHSGNSNITLEIGNSDLDIGGDTLVFPSATMTSTTFASENDYTIPVPLRIAKIFEQPPEVKDFLESNVEDGTEWDIAALTTNILSPLGISQVPEFTSYNWPVKLENHAHTYSFTPSPNVVSGQVPFINTDEDITNVEDITFADDTFMFSMKTNIFIRIN